MNNIFNNTYKGTRVLITGHTGFKGTWLTLWLKELGAEIVGYSLEPHTNPSMFDLCNTEDDIINIIGDIRDSKKLEKILQGFKPDIIFHLAAQPLVRESYNDPKLTYETNVIGTLNVYEAARKCESVKVIISITTDKCYENKEWVYGYRECDPMGGHDPYSSSKACVELLTASYRNSFFEDLGIGIASARAGNVIGGGDWARERLIPDLIRAISKEETLIIRNPTAIRPWQHVLEPLSGYLWLGCLLLENTKKHSCGWNFGPNNNDTLSVEEILKLAINYWGRGKYEIDKSVQPHEAGLLKLDINKAMSELNWNPVYDVEKAVEKTMDWYKSYYEKNIDMNEFTINQIKEYVKEARQKEILWSVI